MKTFYKLSACETVISKQRKVLGAFSPDTCEVAASHNGDSALSFQECCRADNEGKQMSDVFVLVLTVICLGGDLFLLDLFKMLIE